MPLEHTLGIAGATLSLLGTPCFAYDVFRRFKGDAYRVYDVLLSGAGKAEETEKYQAWQSRRSAWLTLGLVLVVTGSALQLAIVVLAAPSP